IQICQGCGTNDDCTTSSNGVICVKKENVGFCNECLEDSDCTTNDKPKCNTETNQCQECLTNADCVVPELSMCVPDSSNMHKCQQCGNNTHCTNPDLPLCMLHQGIMKCHECVSNNDCNEKGKPFCKPHESTGIMVCGDPHVRQTIKGVANGYKFCYNFWGEPGETYLFLKQQNLEIQSTFIEASTTQGGNKNIAMFVGDFLLRQGSSLIYINTDHVLIKDRGKENKYKWDEAYIMLSIGYVHISGNHINIMMNDDHLVIAVMRAERKKHKGSYLNFGISETSALDDDAGGIMGSIGRHASLKRARHATTGIVKWLDLEIEVERISHKCWHVTRESQPIFIKKLDIFKVVNENESGRINKDP
ncbi:unnamed protein product, partial [Owenia fusiformis]